MGLPEWLRRRNMSCSILKDKIKGEGNEDVCYDISTKICDLIRIKMNIYLSKIVKIHKLLISVISIQIYVRVIVFEV